MIPREHGEQGQAAIFAALFLLAVVVSVALLYNSGRLTLTKTHLQNAADSTAYSGALLLARDYNFSAYANRAMVANQVAIAQMVGLRSWSRYYCTLYNDQCGHQNNPHGMPSQIRQIVGETKIGKVYGPALKVYAVDSKAIYLTNQTLDGPIAALSNTINTTLSDATRVYHAGVVAEMGALATQSGVLWRILQDNDPKAQVSAYGKLILADDLQSIAGFTRTYGQNYSGKKRFAAVVMNSLDGFSQNRGGSETLPYPLFNPAAFIPPPYPQFKYHAFAQIWVNYTGGTEFKNNFQSWNAMDVATISGYADFWFWVVTPWASFPVMIPLPVETNPTLFFNSVDMAHAAAGIGPAGSNPLGQSNNFGYETGSQSYGGSYGTNPGPANAQRNAGPGTAITQHYSGLLPYQDVSNTTVSDFQAPAFTLVIDRPQNTVMTTTQIGVDKGATALPGQEAGKQVEVMASAQSHFVRPRQFRFLSNHVVYGNLFNPYWEPHLVPTPSTVSDAAVAAQMAGHG